MLDEVQTGQTIRRSKTWLPPWSWAVLVSAVAWAVMFIAIPPGKQNFPLGDDWAFAHGAIWFTQGLGIHYSRWASMPQLGQWLWSWPFLEIIHLPHVALRVSVIVLSWLGLAAFYDLLRQEKAAVSVSAFAACVLALDPLFFISQGTYMTDVPALSFGLLALNFYSRALNARDARWLLPAVVVTLFAVVTRQTMLAVPLAAGLLFWRVPEIRWKPAWIISIVVPAIVCLYTAWWFSRRTDVQSMQPVFHWMNLLFRPFLALHLCGLVVLPPCLLLGRPRNWRVFLICLVIMMLVANFFRLVGQGLPYGGLFPYTTGMLSLEGTYSDGLVLGQREVLLTPDVRLVLTVLGCIGAAYILTALAGIIRARKFPDTLLAFTLLQFFVMLTLPFIMDRYLEVLFPGAIFLIAVECHKAKWLLGTPAVALSGLISVALLHDWFSWNSARWELGRQAIAAKSIRAGDIDGGFEWNGWFASDDPDKPLPKPHRPASEDHSSLALPFTRFFFPEVTGQYALAFTQPENSVVVASLPYSTWLPPAKKEFLLVRIKPQK